MITGAKDKRAFLLGEHLSHSFSPEIHSYLADYSYTLKELKADELGEFLNKKDFDFLNVTIPYKKDVIPFLDEISDEAREIGAVNTIKKLESGKLIGYNTDFYGFLALTNKSGINVKDKKALILGSGGASMPIRSVVRRLGAAEIIVISRNGKDNYQNISTHYDADVIINTTPVGMFPNNGISPIELDKFTNCSGVIDIIYNPSKTKLLLDAEKLGIKCFGGLYMLVAQAKRAAEIFLDADIDDNCIYDICKTIESKTKNIVLIGMPGCGKTSIGTLISEISGRPFYDSDKLFEEKFSMSPADAINKFGEDIFREMEHKVILELGKLNSSVIATGGGVVTKNYNYDPLHENSTIFFIDRDIEKLPVNNRPLSQRIGLEELYRTRFALYKTFCDHKIICNENINDTANKIIEIMKAGKI